QELVVGLHPTGDGAMTVFLADALDNGAGYATEIGQPENFGRLLADTRGQMTDAWEDPRHASSCIGSCMDCLRSYDNRRLHGSLDWRLALDMLDLLAARPLDAERWTPVAERAASTIADTRLLTITTGTTNGGVPYLLSSEHQRALMVGHPLWQRGDDHVTEERIEAFDEIESVVGRGRVTLSDPFQVLREPLSVLRWLM
ncbi:hypothetical protein, partial [Burkholderia cenocepacia]|uniref:hypothetical protein n=1 Tax=Burkholderia cenocepacia TaxID=95486 RepID=UPI0038CC189E